MRDGGGGRPGSGGGAGQGWPAVLAWEENSQGRKAVEGRLLPGLYHEWVFSKAHSDIKVM